METATIRRQLHKYIDDAEDRKIKAIYIMLEDELDNEKNHWEDVHFVTELDAEYTAWKNGKAQSYSFEDVDNAINALKIKAKSK